MSPNIQSMLVGRFLAGLSGSGFLTVSAGTVADLFVGSQIQAPMMLFTIVRPRLIFIDLSAPSLP